MTLFDDPSVVGGKVCSSCRLWKPLESFNRRSAAPDGRQWSCRACNAAYHRKHKKRINALVHARNKRVWAKNVSELWAYFAEHPCTDCGERDPVVLEFDHLRDKTRAVASLVRGWKWETILAEIEKCDVVCANCHRRRTFKRQGSWRVSNGGGGGARTHKPSA